MYRGYSTDALSFYSAKKTYYIGRAKSLLVLVEESGRGGGGSFFYCLPNARHLFTIPTLLLYPGRDRSYKAEPGGDNVPGLGRAEASSSLFNFNDHLRRTGTN